MRKILVVVLVNIIGIIIYSGYASALRYDGTYEGRVIDADSGEPIEGVVVLGVWYKGQFSPAGTTHRFYDAKETVTDKHGEFKIPGLGLQILSGIEPMNVLIFKAGYEHIGMAPWRGLKEGYVLSKKVKWEGKKAIIQIKKWTLEERRNRFGSYYVNIPDSKQVLLLKEVEKENKELGK